MWLVGRVDYRHPYISALFGVAVLGLAIYPWRKRANSWIPVLASAIIAATGLAWGLDGAIVELRPAIRHGFDPKWFILGGNTLVETFTVILLSTHFLLNLSDRLIRASVLPYHHARA